MTDTNNKEIKIIDKEVKESEVIIGFWESCGYPKYATQNHGIIDDAIKFGFNYSKQLHDNSKKRDLEIMDSQQHRIVELIQNNDLKLKEKDKQISDKETQIMLLIEDNKNKSKEIQDHFKELVNAQSEIKELHLRLERQLKEINLLLINQGKQNTLISELKAEKEQLQEQFSLLLKADAKKVNELNELKGIPFRVNLGKDKLN